MHGTRLSPSTSISRRSCRQGLPVVGLIFLFVQFMSASSTPVVTGSYALLRHVVRGSQAQIRMRIHLVNHGSSDLSIRRITLWDFSHPATGGSRICALALLANASTDAVEEFSISRADYQQWQRGARPRFVLELENPVRAERKAPSKTTTVVRLDRVSAREAK